MEQEMLTLILNRLDGIGKDVKGIKEEVAELKTEVAELKTEVSELKAEVSELKAEVSEVKEDIVLLKQEQQKMNIRLDEVYSIQRSMEENLRVTRAEQEKESYSVAQLQGKVTTMTEKLNKHEDVIDQIRAIQ